VKRTDKKQWIRVWEWSKIAERNH